MLGASCPTSDRRGAAVGWRGPRRKKGRRRTRPPRPPEPGCSRPRSSEPHRQTPEITIAGRLMSQLNCHGDWKHRFPAGADVVTYPGGAGQVGHMRAHIPYGTHARACSGSTPGPALICPTHCATRTAWRLGHRARVWASLQCGPPVFHRSSTGIGPHLTGDASGCGQPQVVHPTGLLGGGVTPVVGMVLQQIHSLFGCSPPQRHSTGLPPVSNNFPREAMFLQSIWRPVSYQYANQMLGLRSPPSGETCRL